VWFVVAPLLGAKNGQIVGMKSNIVLNGADETRGGGESFFVQKWLLLGVLSG